MTARVYIRRIYERLKRIPHSVRSCKACKQPIDLANRRGFFCHERTSHGALLWFQGISSVLWVLPFVCVNRKDSYFFIFLHHELLTCQANLDPPTLRYPIPRTITIKRQLTLHVNTAVNRAVEVSIGSTILLPTYQTWCEICQPITNTHDQSE